MSCSELPVKGEGAIAVLRFVSKTTSASAQTTPSRGLPLEADSSSIIEAQSAIVFSLDKRLIISSRRTKAVEFCALMGTMLGMYRMSMDEELQEGQKCHPS